MPSGNRLSLEFLATHKRPPEENLGRPDPCVSLGEYFGCIFMATVSNF